MGKVFLSYCHKDAHHLAKPRQHTQRLQESKLVELWHDEAIAPGEPWAALIRGNVDESRLVIALVLEERNGRTQFRCEAARLAAKRAVAVWEEREA
jgi:hypothetical protein